MPAQEPSASGNACISVILPDGRTAELPAGATALDLAAGISPSLAKKTIAAVINGAERDATHMLNDGDKVKLITPDSEAGLEILRHDTAHLLAHAVKRLYPETQIAVGPVTENGFFYDFKRDTPFSESDLEKIEDMMRAIEKEALPVTREILSRDAAIARFTAENEPFKALLVGDIPEGEDISVYSEGDFSDLCRGPHAPSTAFPKAFKLMKVSGSYWRGDSEKDKMQRIYGTAWPSKKELELYLKRLEEAEKRDHRKIGAQLNLFHLQEEAQGQIFWHERGLTLYRTLQDYISRKVHANGYREVKTPLMLSRSLWEKSGHWDKFGDMIFTINNGDEEPVAVKPMNCPGHVQIFNKGVRSYRDLPYRLAEFGHVHRNEPSGALHGLMRVRGFVQDDGHIFCTEDQIEGEITAFCSLVREVYADLGFEDIYVKFSDRPEKRAGADDVWDKAEEALEGAMKKQGMEYTLNPGEGAFYGPKLEFVLRDAIGRHWQCGTAQVDFVLPERLDANYIGSDGDKKRPVLIHRAILGSFERFIGIMIEESMGKFPAWLSPVQVAAATITDEFNGYGEEVLRALQDAGARAEADFTSEKISYKIRKLSHEKIPYILALGAKERDARSVSVRRLGSEKTETLPLETFIAQLREDILPPA